MFTYKTIVMKIQQYGTKTIGQEDSVGVYASCYSLIKVGMK